MIRGVTRIEKKMVNLRLAFGIIRGFYRLTYVLRIQYCVEVLSILIQCCMHTVGYTMLLMHTSTLHFHHPHCIQVPAICEFPSDTFYEEPLITKCTENRFPINEFWLPKSAGW